MKRKSLAALIALAALPAAVVASTAIDGGAGTSASGARAQAATYARLATSNSGVNSVIGTAINCTTINVAGINPHPGQVSTLSVTGNGTDRTYSTTDATVANSFIHLTPATT